MPQNRVVAHFKDGRILKGRTRDFHPNRDRFHLETPDEMSLIYLAELKAVFFVKDYAGDKHRQDSYDDEVPGGGRKMKVTFSDGEELSGYATSYSSDRPGFFLVPADLKSNNERIFVVASSCEQVELL